MSTTSGIVEATKIVSLETRIGQRRGAPVSAAVARRLFDEARSMSRDQRQRMIRGLEETLAGLPGWVATDEGGKAA